MSDEPERPDGGADEPAERSAWTTGSFLAGLLLGAAVGVGVALLLAPASGRETRRVLRRRARAIGSDAAGRWVSARDEARRVLREKKESFRDRIDQVADRLD